MQPDVPVLLDVSRNGLLESHHRGSLVLLGADGGIEVALGVPHGPVYARSSLKPLQASALVASGFAGRDAHLALAAASHDGADVHRAGVAEILAAAGLEASALQCPAAYPSSPAALLSYVAGGGGASPVCHGCSGKHAAMLATCVAAGWPVESYLEPDHPLQQAIRATVVELCGEPIVATGVDGCGAPAHALSLAGLARGFAALALSAPSSPGSPASPGSAASPGALVADAMRAYPELVGGTGRAVSELMAGVDGLLCKDGAEGVWGAALPDGRAFAAKVDDGADRALPALLTAALRYWGVSGGVVDKWSAVPVLGGGRPVGAIGWSSVLVQELGL